MTVNLKYNLCIYGYTVMRMATDMREQRGLKIAQIGNQVKRIDERAYKVQSQCDNGKYEVVNTSLGWKCSCPDHIYRHAKCKHIWAVEFSVALKKEVEAKRVEPITSVSNCMFCNSTNIVKDGVRHNKHGDIQKFYCRNCGHYFSFNIGFERMKHNPQAITTAMQLCSCTLVGSR